MANEPELLAVELAAVNIRRLTGWRKSKLVTTGDVGQGGIFGVQLITVREKGRKVEGRLIFLDGQNADGIAAARAGAKQRGAFDVQRRDGGHAGDFAGASKAVDVKPLGGDEGVLGLAKKNDVAVEAAEHLDRAFEQGVEKAELHEDQDDGKSHARQRDDKPPGIMDEILPGERGAHEISGLRL